MNSVRAEWLAVVIRTLQVIAPDVPASLEHASASTSSYAAGVRRRLPPSTTPLEELLLRGLLALLSVHTDTASVITQASRIDEIARPGGGVAEKAKALIETRFMKRLTVSDVARAVRCHPVHLERLFRTSFGVSVHQHLRRVRVRHALELICSDGLKIEAVSACVGFNSRSSLYKAIRDITGQSLAQWREARPSDADRCGR